MVGKKYKVTKVSKSKSNKLYLQSQGNTAEKFLNMIYVRLVVWLLQKHTAGRFSKRFTLDSVTSLQTQGIEIFLKYLHYVVGLIQNHTVERFFKRFPLDCVILQKHRTGRFFKIYTLDVPTSPKTQKGGFSKRFILHCLKKSDVFRS